VAGSGGQAGSTGGGAGGGGSGAGGYVGVVPGCDAATAHERADRALDSLLLNFWHADDEYLHAFFPSNDNLTGYWTFAQAFDAVLDGVERTAGLNYSEWIATFYAGRDARGWIVDYYDDESWMTLALTRAYDITGDAIYLDRAELIYQDIMGGWDTTCCGDHLGGIWWNKPMTQKATASNAGPVIGGVRLAERTGNTDYLDFALMVYQFWWDHMVHGDYEIYDHLSPDGSRALGGLTYNHGLMIGAALALHRATGEAQYLTQAHGFGAYLSTDGTENSSIGPVLHEDWGGACEGDCAAWKGIGYRYLAEVFRQDPSQTAYLTVLESSAESIWTLAGDLNLDLFNWDWRGPAPSSPAGVEAQGSATMALNLYAMLCGPL
jgi:predicted alpha-1,6-mannanase (GH76 family)